MLHCNHLGKPYEIRRDTYYDFCYVLHLLLLYYARIVRVICVAIKRALDGGDFVSLLYKEVDDFEAYAYHQKQFIGGNRYDRCVEAGCYPGKP